MAQFEETKIDDTTQFEQNIVDLARRASRGEVLVKEELDITDDQMEAMYSVAYNLFQNKKYEDAARCFSMLSMLNPLEYKYMFGIGSCLQMNENYEAATLYYTIASGLDESQPAPFLHTAECMLATNEKEAARDSLEITLMRAADVPQFAPIKQRAEVMMNNLDM